MLDREQRAGVLMTVDLLRRTDNRRTGARLTVPMLLGRAIAHEIGHLLLGTSEHPRAGSDARALVARRAARPQAGKLGVLASGSGTNAEPARPRKTAAPTNGSAWRILRQWPTIQHLVLAAAVAALALAAPALAQTSRIGGVVRDETGGNHPRRHRPRGDRRNGHHGRAGLVDDGHRRPRPVRLRRRAGPVSGASRSRRPGSRP